MLQPLGGVQKCSTPAVSEIGLYDSPHHNNCPTQQSALDGNPFTESDLPNGCYQDCSNHVPLKLRFNGLKRSPTLILPREEISLTFFLLLSVLAWQP